MILSTGFWTDFGQFCKKWLVFTFGRKMAFSSQKLGQKASVGVGHPDE